MSLGAALVDDCIHLERVAAGDIDGRPRTALRRSQPIRCRLTFTQDPEGGSGPNGSVVRRPSLLLARRDRAGSVVHPTSASQFEVTSRELGTRTWQVDGDPEPLRRRRTLLGWQIRLLASDTTRPASP